ncbi:shufflon system plasmid conjugative transfer pilus tip adhesin PilV, partial [Escherichia coli]|uniref:shufflon system plasmid conjugative transfer pilus tip adhesin PilV n=1 Tax=Escherichia coli TaxID=562 RepID=UPI000245EA1F
TLRYIAAAIDGYGGFVYSGSMPSGCTSSTTTVNGAACGWTLDLSGFGISTTSGHIAVNLGADIAGSAGSGGDFLHRYSVPGHAEYNQMNTALDMNGKNVNRAGNLLVTSDGKSSDDHGSSGSTGFVGWASGSASGTASDATSLRAGLYFSTSAPSGSDKESVWIKTTSNTSLDVTGKVRAATVKGTRLITSEGYLMPGKTVTANTSCTPAALGISDLLADTTGLVAHDSTGATLSCQSGAWKKNASGSTVLTGRIANGQQIPLPSGFSASQCSWSVSNAENPHGWKPNYFAGSVATYDSNRIVTCGYYDEY